MRETEPLLRFPVWEPAGRDVVFRTEQELSQHVLILGATGSGKTCLLHRAIEQLMHHREIGLLIFDAKGDDTVERVRAMAKSAGRSEALVVLGPAGTHYINLFHPLRSLADTDRMTRRLLSGSGSMGSDNAYWDEFRFALFDAALTLLVIAEHRVRFGPAMTLLHDWLLSPKGATPPAIRAAADQAARYLGEASPIEARKISQALNTIQLWQNIDERTRGNVQSTLLIALRPLLSIPAANCFEPAGRSAFNPADVANRKMICVASFNATLEGRLAELFFTIIKDDFLSAVQQRKHDRYPLCGIIADEMPLLISRSDAEALCTIRSRRCFFLGASQSVAAIEDRVGVRARKSLVANFGSIIFLRSREEETDLLATISLGTRDRLRLVHPPSEEGSLLSINPQPVREKLLVCPPGELSRLAPHQGYVSIASAPRCDTPVAFVPWFKANRGQQPRGTVEAPQSLRHLKRLLNAHGFAEQMDEQLFRAAIRSCLPDEEHEHLVEFLKDFFQRRAEMVPCGLELLPQPWLKGLPGILSTICTLDRSPYKIGSLSECEGLLLLQFVEETCGEFNAVRATGWDRIRIAANASLYPTRWRPLTLRHRRKIQLRWPELMPASDWEIL